MNCITGITKYVLVIFIFFHLNGVAQVVRILPLGNSLTYDSNSLDDINPRPIGDRIAYRYKLYQLLVAAGYSFDYVGSENSGNNYFQDTELDDNAGFPGINDAQLAYLINTGYNQRITQYEAPGPYMLYYPADIILLEIGTNDLNESPNDVKNILDNIRVYDFDAIILVSRIINRRTYSSVTTTFNNNVEAMVNARGDDRIKMVNLETGAGINYSTEMIDELHPKQSGYDKVANKWFEAINNLNQAPVISSIPAQSTLQGTAFSSLILDNYVTDLEDPDNLLQWTYTLQPNSKLSVTLDGSRMVQVISTDMDWYGNETIKLKVEDSGNGAFKKTDSIEVSYTVLKANEPPVITSQPITSINEDNNYTYTISAEDNDGNALTYSAVQIQTWMAFSPATHTLCGRPTNNDVGVYNIVLRVSDGSEYTEQDFELVVNNVNDLPIITTAPDTVVHLGEAYLYEFAATDIDVGDVLVYSVVYKPSWLSFSTGSNSALLFGNPPPSNTGSNSIILKVNDGYEDVLLGYTLFVMGYSDLKEGDPDQNTLLYPNPAHNTAYFKVPQRAKIRLLLYDLTGTLKKEINSINTNELEIDVSDLSKGLYIYKAFVNSHFVSGKLTIID